MNAIAQVRRLEVGTALLAAVAACCWVVTAQRMQGMDMGPGTDLGSFGFFAGIWVTMIAAMMLPSAIPAITRAGKGRFVFAASYVAVWATVGTCAYLVYEAVRGMHPGFLDWDAGGRYLAAAAVVAAGLYQLTPLKRSCLRRCRAQRPAERPLASAARYGT